MIKKTLLPLGFRTRCSETQAPATKRWFPPAVAREDQSLLRPTPSMRFRKTRVEMGAP